MLLALILLLFYNVIGGGNIYVFVLLKGLFYGYLYYFDGDVDDFSYFWELELEFLILVFVLGLVSVFVAVC